MDFSSCAYIHRWSVFQNPATKVGTLQLLILLLYVTIICSYVYTFCTATYTLKAVDLISYNACVIDSSTYIILTLDLPPSLLNFVN